MTREEANAKMTAIVKAVGKSISDNAENIVGNLEYGQTVSINVEIGNDFIPTISATRNFITQDIIDVLGK